MLKQFLPMCCFAAMLAAAQHAAGAAAENVFNPKISLILSGSYSHYSASGAAQTPGFLLGPETELRPAGLALGESELALEANIDHQFHGWASLGFEQEDGETVVAVEEAYVNTLSLPAGLALKLGRFFSDIGYHNRLHAHAWDFADAPLVYRAFLANTYGDDGLQLRWVAATPLFLEFGAEALRGAAFPAGGEQRSGIGAWAAFVHLGGDAGTGGSWRVGLSHLATDADQRISGEDSPTAFRGDSGTTIVDAVYKWAPQGNAIERNFVVQAEAFARSEDGEVTVAAHSSRYRGDQFGLYVQSVYQFRRGWRAGLRYDMLRADNALANPGADTPLSDLALNANSWRISAMLDWSSSEFSRLRLQFNRDESRVDGGSDNQLFLQYIYSLGAHPAHQF